MVKKRLQSGLLRSEKARIDWLSLLGHVKLLVIDYYSEFKGQNSDESFVWRSTCGMHPSFDQILEVSTT